MAEPLFSPQRRWRRRRLRSDRACRGRADLRRVAGATDRAARALPLLESADDRFDTADSARQIVPRRAGAQHPEHAVQDGARIGPRPPAPIGAPTRTEHRFEHGPLGVSQVHAVEYDGDRNFVHNPAFGVYEIGSSLGPPCGARLRSNLSTMKITSDRKRPQIRLGPTAAA